MRKERTAMPDGGEMRVSVRSTQGSKVLAGQGEGREGRKEIKEGRKGTQKGG